MAILNISGGFNVNEQYTGVYTIIPQSYDQELDTDKKVMKEDVTVTEIPFTMVSNPAGGLTINIGEEV